MIAVQRLLADLEGLGAALPLRMPEALRADVLHTMARIESLVANYPRPPFPMVWVEDLDNAVRQLTARLYAQQVDG